MSKKVKHICKNCMLFDPKNRICTVTFLMDGEDYILATKPEDECHLEKSGLLDHLQTAGVWSDGKDGYVEFSDDPA